MFLASRPTFAIVAALALAGPASPLAAQRPQTRAGLYFGTGFGFGSLGVTNADSRMDGAMGYVRFGTTVTPHLLLGVETGGWQRSGAGPSFETGYFVATATYYPVAKCGWFLKGGPGAAGAEAGDAGFGGETEHGFALLAGGGYDYRVGANVSITPSLQYVWGSFDPGKTNNVQLSIGVTIH